MCCLRLASSINTSGPALETAGSMGGLSFNAVIQLS
jgi:hypothetical protein